MIDDTYRIHSCDWCTITSCQLSLFPSSQYKSLHENVSDWSVILKVNLEPILICLLKNISIIITISSNILHIYLRNDYDIEELIISSVQFSHSVVSDSLRPHELHHARPPCPSPTPGVHSNSHPSSRWCHPAISSSVVPFSSCPQSLPASDSFPMSQLFAWGGQSTEVSALASVLPKNTQDWSPLG